MWLPAGGIPIAVATQELREHARAFLLGDAIFLLVSTHGLIVLAGGHAQLVIGQLAPPLSHTPAELLPLAFEPIPVHVNLLPLLLHAVHEVGSPLDGNVDSWGLLRRGNNPAREKVDLYASAHLEHGLPASIESGGTACAGDTRSFTCINQ